MAATTASPPKASRRRHIAVIPCRWGASRFPSKPLARLGDKPLLWHVHQRCLEATSLDSAVVATDDERIEAACHELGIDCVRTGEHATGTDRVAECAERLRADAYINVQGDEPFIEPSAIDALSDALADLDSRTLAVNAYAELSDTAAVLDHNVVKVVVGTDSQALMFSRQPIPYPAAVSLPSCDSSAFTASHARLSNASGSSRRALSNRPRASRCSGSSSTATECRCCPCPTAA